MKIIAAPDSFKGSLSAIRAAEAIEEGIKIVFKDAEVVKVPIADGGEGTVDAIITAANGEIIYKEVAGPLNRPVNAKMAIINGGGTAVIEMAEASGITLVTDKEKNPLVTTTYGTGELILEAINRNCKRIVIGIGGSATNDCGAGMAQALGFKLLDEHMSQIGFGGGELSKVKEIKMSPLYDKIKDIEIIVACDVTNPLCGQKGASAIFGPQKGATPNMVNLLDSNLSYFGDIIKRDLKKDVKDIPGAGAAGGLGAALIAFLDARLMRGVEMVLDAVNFDDKLRDADLVITGEGRIDSQSVFGKVPMGVAKAAKKYGVPVIAVGGSIGDGAEALYDVGVDAIACIMTHPMSLEFAMTNSFELLKSAVERLMRVYAIDK